jgi:hypothetical protein
MVRLPPPNVGLLLEAAVRLAYARVRLPFARFAAVPPGQVLPPPGAAELARARSVSRAMAAVACRSPARFTCLHRSLALWWMLRARGIACELRIGVRNGSEPLAAHAWVQVTGEPLNEAADVADHYRAFAQAVQPQGFRWPIRPDPLH